MIDVKITCTYCGNEGTLVVIRRSQLEGKRCSVCNDKNLKIQELDTSRIDYYQGVPAFPTPTEESTAPHYDDYSGYGDYL